MLPPPEVVCTQPFIEGKLVYKKHGSLLEEWDWQEAKDAVFECPLARYAAGNQLQRFHLSKSQLKEIDQKIENGVLLKATNRKIKVQQSEAELLDLLASF